MGKPFYLAAIDTEDDSKGNVDIFCIVHENGIYTTSVREDFLLYVMNMASSLKKFNVNLEIWCTNLEYDLVNIFGAEHIHKIKLIFGKTALVGASWEKYRIEFRDTVRHIPASVKELGELVGLPKLEFAGKETPRQRLDYCIRDTTITFRAAKFIRESYKEFGVEPKMTLPATALKIWKKHFWKRAIYLPPKEILTNAKLAYYGGRTEPFGIGEFKDIYAIDAASMFPYAMKMGNFPLPWGMFSRVRADGDIKPNGIYNVNVYSSVQTPVLPYRTKAGLIYPNGRFSGWYVGEEILYAESVGVKTKLISGFEFLESCDPFNEYVDNFFKKKQMARGPARTTYKLLLNSLYGKFGQTGEHINAIPVADFVKLRPQPDDFRIWNGIAIFKEVGEPPDWGNNLWPAFITARARIRLHQEILKIKKKGGIPLYCDTDSVIFSAGKEISYPESVSIPGKFESRGKYLSILIRGKKEYGLEAEKDKWEIHCKGIPGYMRETYLRTGEAEYEKPVRIKESARVKVDANVWHSVRKQRRVNFNDRTMDTNGILSPIVVREKGV